MNSADRLELDAILREQVRLRNLVTQLDGRIAELNQRLEKPEAVPILHEPPPLPKAAPSPRPAPVPAAPLTLRLTPVEPTPIAHVVEKTPAPPPVTSPAPAESIELKLGTYWLARVGIVVLLTGFVFLGNYAYHHIVPLLGAWGKLTLLGLGGTVLSGAGAWLHRGRESMRNYARVLLAGGAATFYYTAYAAHFVAALRVIESPLLGGALLLLLAGGFLWFAERRRSQSLAFSAVLLSYYTAAINPIDRFALFSNLLLTAVAVFLLVRHRWVALSIASLAATYGTYGFWRLHAVVSTGAGGSDFEMALGFLAGYWLLFTVAVFLCDRDALAPIQRTAFLTVNNGALFTYAALLFAVHRRDVFWIFALAYGATLLVLALIAARRRPDDRAIDGAYLAQGLALVAVGCAAKFSGPQLATIFAVESAVLLTLSRVRHRWLCEIAAGLCVLAAFVFALDAIEKNPALQVSLGGTVALLLLFDAWWLKHLRGELAGSAISIKALGFAAFGLLLAGVIIWKTVPDPWRPAAFATAALVCAVSVRAVRLPEIAFPGQLFLLVATGTFVARHVASPPDPSWSPFPLLVIALVLTHWWQHQRALPLGTEAKMTLQLACAAATIATGIGWLHAVSRGIIDDRLVVTSVAAFGSLLYGAATRSWAIALTGQLFTVLSIQTFASAVLSPLAGSRAALAPIANLAATSLLLSRVTVTRFPALPGGGSVGPLALIYRIAANALLIAWGFAFIDAAWLTVFFAALGASHLFGGSLLRDRERSITGVVHAALAFAIFWTSAGSSVAWRDLFAILVLPASLRLGHRFAGATPLPAIVRNLVVAIPLASVWLWLTRYVTAHHTSSGLTPAWALLALVVFIAGLVLRERVYRLGGFAILALAIGRIFIVDVWQLETLYRILSFLVLGGVLLVLGYVYNRFADSIRRWL